MRVNGSIRSRTGFRSSSASERSRSETRCWVCDSNIAFSRSVGFHCECKFCIEPGLSGMSARAQFRLTSDIQCECLD
jgi:hypothetical protein